MMSWAVLVWGPLLKCESSPLPLPFPRCSRLYWSTLDARKRCWYKCRVLEYRPKLSQEEPDALGVQEENHTIVHSPAAPLAGKARPVFETGSPPPPPLPDLM